MKQKIRKLLPFFLTLLVIILINVASTTLFFRVDLTKNTIFSLSPASEEAVRELREPLTIKVYLSENLPSPYNNVRQSLRDLLEEYALEAERENGFFNYSINIVPAAGEMEGDDEAAELEDEAQSYGIYPIQVQNVQQDEVKLQTVYMGMAFIHGDMLETIPALTSTEDLEYRITSTIDTMSRKISTLLAMKEEIRVTLYLSANLYPLGEDVANLPNEIEGIVADLNEEYYGRLDYTSVDPTDTASPGKGEELAEQYGFSSLRLRSGGSGADQVAYAALVVARGEEHYSLDLISRGVFGLELAGAEELEETISDTTDALIGLNEEVGYVTGFGTPPLSRQQAQMDPNATDLSSFQTLLSREYQIKEINLEKEPIPEGLSSLFLVGPREKLSDFALYQLDQFLLRGGSLLLFLDSHTMVVPQQQSQFGQQPVYIPQDTGLEKLLKHYGFELKKSYVMDEECFVQRQQTREGGVSEMPIYFAPLISKDRINGDIPYLRNIPQIILLNISPFSTPASDTKTDTSMGGEEEEKETEETEPSSLEVTPLMYSSENAWTVSENINLTNPYMIQPPPEDEQKQLPLAFLVEGEFTSYFKGKDIPEPPKEESPSGEEAGQGSAGQGGAGQEGEGLLDEEQVSLEEDMREEGRGNLFLLGSSSVLGSNVLGPDRSSGNSLFLLNMVDHLNGRTDYAIMRTKGVRYSPLKKTSPATRSFIKGFNILGLAIIMVVTGLFAWMIRGSKRKRIRNYYEGFRKKESEVAS